MKWMLSNTKFNTGYSYSFIGLCFLYHLFILHKENQNNNLKTNFQFGNLSERNVLENYLYMLK